MKRRINKKEILMAAGLFAIVLLAIFESKGFDALSMYWQFNRVIFIMAACGAWFGYSFEGVVEAAWDRRHIGLLFPGIVSWAILFEPLVGTYGHLLGLGFGTLTMLLGFAMFWVATAAAIIIHELVKNHLWTSLKNIKKPVDAITDIMRGLPGG